MKISAGMPALDLAPPSVAASNDGSAGKDFEVAVQDVAAKAENRDKSGLSGKDADKGAVRGKPGSDPSASHRAAKTAADEAEAAEDALSKDEAASVAATTPAADLLGRLLLAAGLAAPAPGGKADGAAKGAEPAAGLSTLSDAEAAALAAVALAAAPEDGTTFDGALEERLVITPLGAGSAEAKAAGKTGGAGGVGLEVLHMETHFEPRVDDVVLVEGAADTAAASAPSEDGLGGVLSSIRRSAGAAGAATLTGQAGAASAAAAAGAPAASDRGRASSESLGPTTRFDETLARLSAGEGAGLRQEGKTGQRGTREDRRSGAASVDDGRRAAARSEATAGVDVETVTTVPVPAPGSMTGQIADRIIDAFRPASGGQRTADLPAEATHLRLTAGGAALKTLTIQLQPENLGKLEVSMRLVDGRLTLELAASSAQTAVALAGDRAGLKKLLEHAGFSMDEASITIVSRDSAAQMTRAGAAQDANGSAQQGSSGDGQRGSSGSSADNRGFERGSGSGGQDSARGGRRPVELGLEAPPRRSASTFL